jgi:hypothetical protein
MTKKCNFPLFSFQKFLGLIDQLELGIIFWIGLYCHVDFISSIWRLLFRPHVLLTGPRKIQKYPWFWTQSGLDLTFQNAYIDWFQKLYSKIKRFRIELPKHKNGGLGNNRGGLKSNFPTILGPKIVCPLQYFETQKSCLV